MTSIGGDEDSELEEISWIKEMKKGHENDNPFMTTEKISEKSFKETVLKENVPLSAPLLSVDSNLSSVENSSLLMDALLSEIPLKIEPLSISFSFQWNSDPSIFALFVPFSQLVHSATNIAHKASLISTRKLLFLYGKNAFIKEQKAKINKLFQHHMAQKSTLPTTQMFNQQDIDCILFDLQVKHRVLMIFHCETMLEVADMVVKITKSISSIKKHSTEEQVGFVPEKIRKFTDATSCFTQMLQRINGVSEPIAKAITRVYPSICALLKEYTRLPDQEAQLVLADIIVERAGRSEGKKIGASLSRKIHATIK